MNQKLYLECYAGISGDMTAAALLDLGADEERLLRTLETLKVDGYTAQVRRVKKAGLDVCDFSVRMEDARAGRDHDMEYLYGNGRGEEPEDCGHEHRNLAQIGEILRDSDLTERAKQTAVRIFTILAEAEAKAHGVPVEEVHFHEVGAVDSIVDIAAAAICLDDLAIDDVIVPALWEGWGTVRCRHGILPIPVPATLNIVRDYRLKMHRIDEMGEFVTPTGAAIAAAICTEDRLPECYRVDRVGLGGGKREHERPGILRAMLITPVER